MKIVIAGLAKSGTSALAFRIKNTLPRRAIFLHEPARYAPSIEDLSRSVAAKILLYNAPNEVDYESFGHFDKKILVVRDPRDRLISSILYQVAGSFWEDERKVSKFIELLKHKESAPDTVSVLTIMRLLEEYRWHYFWKKSLSSPKPGKIRKRLENINFWKSSMYGGHLSLTMEFHSRHQDYFVIKYEDFISGATEGLERYLGFRLSSEVIRDKRLDMVARTKKSGGWKDWFLDEDIAFFRPRFLDFMKKYRYADKWKINKNPRIYAEYSSKYVRWFIEERRASERP